MRIIMPVVIVILLFLNGNGVAQDNINLKPLADLPVPISNNATALVKTGNRIILLSFKGLKQGKSWQDTTNQAYRLSPGQESWQQITSVPGKIGELAATAQGLGGFAYVFGGYTVAKDHTEVTVTGSYRYDPEIDQYERLPDIPVAVDDSVSFSVGDRYIYLISGWHNSGNVNLSQVYDTVERRWFQATPFPGSAVFGHAGAAVGNRFVICDGVEKITPLQGKSKYQAVESCFKGEVDPTKPSQITWSRLPPHPGKPLYRMAAGGYQGQGDWIVFAGGSDNPYNYDGIGYDKKPSEPSDLVFAYSLEDGKWVEVGQLDKASMDHRNLVVKNNQFFLIGGMRATQKTTNAVVEFCLSDETSKLSAC